METKKLLEELMNLSDEEKQRCIWHNVKVSAKNNERTNLDYCGACEGVNDICDFYKPISKLLESYERKDEQQ